MARGTRNGALHWAGMRCVPCSCRTLKEPIAQPRLEILETLLCECLTLFGKISPYEGYGDNSSKMSRQELRQRLILGRDVHRVICSSRCARIPGHACSCPSLDSWSTKPAWVSRN